MNRYFIGALALIGLVVLLIFLLFSGNNKATQKKSLSLVSYANTNAEVKMVVDGPIVAPQNHNTAEVIVSQNSATFNLIQGYDGYIIASKIYNNTENSYSNFLYALYYAGFTNGFNNSNYSSDTGLCPTGNRYDFYLINNGKTLLHYWNTNCISSPHTFNGDFSLTLNLFNSQIPDISKLSYGSNF